LDALVNAAARFLMGGKLGTLFARAGHEVISSYARGEQKLRTPDPLDQDA
jgi:hypothetical protein